MSELRPSRWLRAMRGRDKDEPHRSATPLELLFDLCFVVAVAIAAEGLHHGLVEGHLGVALRGYLLAFVAIWWAWVNFSWFASAFDTDDAAYRLLTLVQMAGVLIMAAGLPAAFAEGELTIVTAGYVVMRASLIPQWLRARRGHPECRRTATIYAAGLTVLQIGWIARLLLPHGTGVATYLVLLALDLGLPMLAERRGDHRTPWHPEHIAERYGLFTIIVLGEVILATSRSIQQALAAGGSTTQLVIIATGALLTVFAMWWLYFERSSADALRATPDWAFLWSYAHYGVFGSVAAVGAAIGAMADALGGSGHGSPRQARAVLAGAVGLYLVILALLHGRGPEARRLLYRLLGAAALVCGVTLMDLAPAYNVLGTGLVLSLAVATSGRA